MAWDSSRPVPWRRLLKEYAVYAAIMAVVLVVLFRDENVLALLAGIVIAGPIYFLLGAVLAKFGYQRKTLAELRTPRATTTSAAATSVRARPAPTRRTAPGPPARSGPRGRKRR